MKREVVQEEQGQGAKGEESGSRISTPAISVQNQRKEGQGPDQGKSVSDIAVEEAGQRLPKLLATIQGGENPSILKPLSQNNDIFSRVTPGISIIPTFSGAQKQRSTSKSRL